MDMSPRLSFSSDLPPPPISRLDDDPPSDEEFDFTTSFEVSTPADLLFSQGRLLPLLRNNNNNNNNTSIDSAPPPPPPKSQTLRQILANDHRDNDDDDNVASCSSSSRKSSASCSSNTTHAFARSSSVSVVSSSRTGSGPFPRSKSAGCNPDRSRRQGARGSKFWKLPPRESSSGSSSSSSSNSNAKAYYYSGDRRASSGNGVRINPVINLPAPFIPRGGSSNSSSSVGVRVSVGTSSFFAYLLCNCRDKTTEANEVEKESLDAASL